MKITGAVKVSPGRIVVDVPLDLGRYLRKLIYFEFPNLIGGLNLPKHGSHVTICRSEHYKINQERAQKWHGTPIRIDIDFENIYIGGFNKGFVGFYVKVFGKMLDIIRNDVTLFEICGDFHLSICNSKNISYRKL